MEGPPLGPGGEDITWPDQVAPRGRKESSTRKIKPQTSNLKPSPPPADAADPDEPAAEGSNQPVLTTQNILPSASSLPAGQLYADDGSLVGR